MCEKWFGAVFFYKFKQFKLSQILNHCNTYYVSNVFLFSFEGRTMILFVNVPCYCLSLTLHYLYGPLLFWSIKGLGTLKRNIMLQVYTESFAYRPILVSQKTPQRNILRIFMNYRKNLLWTDSKNNFSFNLHVPTATPSLPGNF